MADEPLGVEVQDDSIIVTMPGTRFEVTYQKCVEEPGLGAKSFWIPDDAQIEQTEFLALAWRVKTATQSCARSSRLPRRQGPHDKPALVTLEHRAPARGYARWCLDHCSQ
jgi:hypothetical protein